jgi:hypothetical protein
MSRDAKALKPARGVTVGDDRSARSRRRMSRGDMVTENNDAASATGIRLEDPFGGDR